MSMSRLTYNIKCQDKNNQKSHKTRWNFLKTISIKATEQWPPLRPVINEIKW